MTYGHLRADCLYTGISSGHNTRYRVWEFFTFTFLCLSVCVYLSDCPRGYLRNHTRDLYQIFVHVAYVSSSVLLRHVDVRPHCLSAGRGDGSAQRGRSVIYDCLVDFVWRIYVAGYDIE